MSLGTSSFRKPLLFILYHASAQKDAELLPHLHAQALHLPAYEYLRYGQFVPV